MDMSINCIETRVNGKKRRCFFLFINILKSFRKAPRNEACHTPIIKEENGSLVIKI